MSMCISVDLSLPRSLSAAGVNCPMILCTMAAVTGRFIVRHFSSSRTAFRVSFAFRVSIEKVLMWKTTLQTTNKGIIMRCNWRQPSKIYYYADINKTGLHGLSFETNVWRIARSNPFPVFIELSEYRIKTTSMVQNPQKTNPKTKILVKWGI